MKRLFIVVMILVFMGCGNPITFKHKTNVDPAAMEKDQNECWDQAKTEMYARKEKAKNSPGTFDNEMFTGSGQGQYIRAILRQEYIKCMEKRGYEQVKEAHAAR